MPPSSFRIQEPDEFCPATDDLGTWMTEFNAWNSAVNPGCAYIGFSPLPDIQTDAVTAGAHDFMTNLRTQALLNDRRYKPVGDTGHGTDNTAHVLLQQDIQFFLLIARKFKCYDQHYAHIANYTASCGTKAFAAIIAHHNSLPKLRIQLELINMLSNAPTGDTAGSHAASCRATSKIISKVGKIDAATIGKLYQAASAARSKDAIIAAIGTDALQSPSITLAEMMAKIENYERTSLATDLMISEATQQVLMASTPTPPRSDNNRTFQRDGLEKCKQCGESFKDIYFHLYSQHYDSLKELTQQRLSAKFGSRATSNHHGARNVLAVTTPGDSSASGGAPLSFHDTLLEYEASGLTSFLWDGKIVNINARQ